MGLLDALGPAADIGSSLLSAWGAKKDRDLAKDQFNTTSKEFIQNRVADAKKAGIHPLYAIGASGQPSPTVHISGQSSVGSHLGEGLQNAAETYTRNQRSKTTPGQAQLQTANVRAVNASAARDEAQAMLFNSQRKRAEVQAVTNLSPPGIQPGGATTYPALEGAMGNIIANPYSDPAKIEDAWGEAVGDFYNVTNWLGALLKKYGVKMPMGGFTPHSTKRRYIAPFYQKRK